VTNSLWLRRVRLGQQAAYRKVASGHEILITLVQKKKSTNSAVQN